MEGSNNSGAWLFGGIVVVGAVVGAWIWYRNRDPEPNPACAVGSPLWNAASQTCSQWGQDSVQCQQERARYEQVCGTVDGWHPGVI